jgi:hypothetical protein
MSDENTTFTEKIEKKERAQTQRYSTDVPCMSTENVKHIHSVKLHSQSFDEFKSGGKQFALVKNDCNFKVGDVVCLLRHADGHYIDGCGQPCSESEAECIMAPIRIIMESCEGLVPGYCILLFGTVSSYICAECGHTIKNVRTFLSPNGKKQVHIPICPDCWHKAHDIGVRAGIQMATDEMLSVVSKVKEHMYRKNVYRRVAHV